jgi:ATP-dependent Lhr-like helicase
MQGLNDLPVYDSPGYKVIERWMQSGGRHPFLFQEQTWQAIHEGKSGLVNAPTGCGKTFLFSWELIQFINAHPKNYQSKQRMDYNCFGLLPSGIGKDIGRAMEEVIEQLEMNWKIGIRNETHDTSERNGRRDKCPKC